MADVMVAVVLGIVEGLTEFAPVSSTGHLILFGALLGFTGERATTFDVVIEFGAVLAVALLYRAHLLGLVTGQDSDQFSGPQGRLALALTKLPALIVAALAHDLITQRLFNPVTVALGMGIGGVVMLVVRRRPQPTGVANLSTVTPRRALAIGLVQCLALWPGISRSAATILGGMTLGLNRGTSVEYSFLAAIPVIGAAAVFELAQSWSQVSLADLPLFAAGFTTAFVSVWLVVRYSCGGCSRPPYAPLATTGWPWRWCFSSSSDEGRRPVRPPAACRSDAPHRVPTGSGGHEVRNRPGHRDV